MRGVGCSVYWVRMQEAAGSNPTHALKTREGSRKTPAKSLCVLSQQSESIYGTDCPSPNSESSLRCCEFSLFPNRATLMCSEWLVPRQLIPLFPDSKSKRRHRRPCEFNITKTMTSKQPHFICERAKTVVSLFDIPFVWNNGWIVSIKSKSGEL